MPDGSERNQEFSNQHALYLSHCQDIENAHEAECQRKAISSGIPEAVVETRTLGINAEGDSVRIASFGTCESHPSTDLSGDPGRVEDDHMLTISGTGAWHLPSFESYLQVPSPWR